MALLQKYLCFSSLYRSKITENKHTKKLRRKIHKVEKKLDRIFLFPFYRRWLMKKHKYLYGLLENVKIEHQCRRNNIWRELEQEVRGTMKNREENTKGLTWLQRIEKEFRELPVISVFDDLVDGISGIDRIKQYVEEHKEEPLAWLLFAQALLFHQRAYIVVQGVKFPIDTIGTVLDIGVNKVSEFIKKEEWTATTALAKAIELSSQEENPIHCMIRGRAYQVLGYLETNGPQKEKYMILAEQYLHFALVSSISLGEKGELFYYLSQIHFERRDFDGYVINLKEAIQFGFVPAQTELQKFTRERKYPIQLEDIQIPIGVPLTKGFTYQYKNSAFKIGVQATQKVVKEQVRKTSNLVERALDFGVSHFTKDKS